MIQRLKAAAARADLSASRIEGTLQRLFDSSPAMPLSPSDRFIIVSDLHMGDGSPRDDFLPNGELLCEALGRYYLARGYSLVLNGDIEELQRFPLEDIKERWRRLYELFDAFGRRSSVYRIVGNHDEALWWRSAKRGELPLHGSLRLSFGGDTLFIFHGHQATIFFERFNDISGFFLRHFANRLHIRNIPARYESTRKYRIEHRIYAFSSARRIVSIIGHTHRPLFESLSKIDMLRSRIEQLSREYTAVPPRSRRAIRRLVQSSTRELVRLWEKDRQDGSLASEHLFLPCLFNSGCAIGKRGLTGLEISDGRIALVHWFDRRRGDHHLHHRGIPAFAGDGRGPAERLEGTEYYRTVLRQDRLEFVFSRIRLLAGT